MRKFLKKLLKKSPAVAIVAALVFILPSTARAIGFLDVLTNPLSLFVVVSGIVVDIIGYALITFAGGLVNFAFSYQRFVETSIVQIGWTLVRDMANMAFILVMLAVAFSTILQFETYGFKKIIPKLVIVALTINFSLIICGIIIDFGNSLSMFFINGGTPGGPAEVGTNIMKATRAGAMSQLRNVSGSQTATLAAVTMQLIFYIALAFILFAIGLVMMWRILKLWILIISAPAAWVAYIIKPGMFKKWWSEFINLAVVFPVVMSFFVFLSMIVGTTFQRSDGPFTNIGTSASAWSRVFPDTAFSVILQFLVVLSFLGYGIAQAGKTGTAGGAMAVKWAGQGKNWAMGKMKAGGKTTGKFAVGATAGVAGGAAVRAADRTGLTRGLAQGRDWLEKQPLIGKALGGPGAGRRAKEEKLKKDARAYTNFTPKDLEDTLKQTPITSADFAKQAAAAKALIDKDNFSLHDNPDFQKNGKWLKMLQNLQNKGGNISDLLISEPGLMFDGNLQNMLAQDPNNPAMAKKWQDVIAASGRGKEELIEKLFNEDVYKSASDFARMKVDRKGKLSKDESDRFDGIEGEKTTAMEKRYEEEKLAKRKTEALEAEIGRLESKGQDSMREEAELDMLRDQEREAIRRYTATIKDCNTRQVAITKRFAQDKIIQFVIDGLRMGGGLYAGHMSAMLSKSKKNYVGLTKELKFQSLGEGKELKDGVKNQLFAGLVANSIIAPTEPPAPPPASPPAPPPASPNT